jgi:hypothetical protein
MKQKIIKWTVHAAAVEFGVSRETIERGLRQAGIKAESFSRYTTRQIFTALAGDFKAERIRNLRLDAEAKERAAAIEIGQLQSRDRVEELVWFGVLEPIRSGLMQLHSVTFKQVDYELNRAQTPQTTCATVQEILVGAFDKMLADIRAAFPQQTETAKHATHDTTNETKNENPKPTK